MQPNKTITIFFSVLVTFSSTKLCHAQKDSLLTNTIEWTTTRIDKDTALDCFYTGLLSQQGGKGFLAFYVKDDSINKVVMLNEDSSGTQMKTYYYANSIPILIIVKHNNFQLSHDIKQYSEAILSFNSGSSISTISNVSRYVTDRQTNFYIDGGKAYHSYGISLNPKKNETIESNDDALLLVFEAKYLLSSFNRKQRFY
jgi:hypothetical protein